MPSTFEELVAEGSAVPTEGWDFSWFEGRATEQRPSWGYARLMGERMRSARSALDVQTGGGEVLATIPQPPPRLAATESWPPNLAKAAAVLAPLGGEVVEVSDDGDLPFADESFDLVVSRHPVVTRWDEVGRVLRPGGTYLSQQIGPGSMHGLTEAMMGPTDVSPAREPERAVAALAAAGVTTADLRDEWLRVEFFDIAAVVHFLRKVIWTVPGFDAGGYEEPLRRLHERITAEGSFVCRSRRYLIDARKE